MPTELDTMKHAKEYIDKLANGIDPFTDKPVPDDDIVNNVKLSRCFFGDTRKGYRKWWGSNGGKDR